MYWIELQPDWQAVSGGRPGHVSKVVHRWTEDLSYQEILELAHRIERSGFGNVEIDDTTGRLTTLIVMPRITSAEPKEGSQIPSMGQRLETIIANFMGER